MTLIYGTNGTTCHSASVRQSIDIETRKRLEAEWEWDFKRSGILPPGSEVWWQWEITDITGYKFQTEKVTATIEDQRHEWQSISGGGITVLWYEGPRSFGQSILSTAQKGLAHIKETIGTDPSGNITISIYPTYEEVQSALLYSNEWTGGVAIPEHNAIIIGIPDQDLNWAAEIIPHELTHLVVATTIFNCKGNDFPVWLNEGLAEFIEDPIDDEERETVITALENGDLPSLASLADGFSGQSMQAVRSYTQSAMVVKFMIAEYGITPIPTETPTITPTPTNTPTPTLTPTPQGFITNPSGAYSFVLPTSKWELMVEDAYSSICMNSADGVSLFIGYYNSIEEISIDEEVEPFLKDSGLFDTSKIEYTKEITIEKDIAAEEIYITGTYYGNPMSMRFIRTEKANRMYVIFFYGWQETIEKQRHNLAKILDSVSLSSPLVHGLSRSETLVLQGSDPMTRNSTRQP